MFVNLRSICITRVSSCLNLLHTSAIANAGHSKWANIKHTKGLKDQEKAGLFNSYAKKIRLAIQDGKSANPQLNTPLKSVIEEALRKKMPNSTIQNTLKRYSDPTSSKLTTFFVDIRVLNKIYLVVVLCTENIPGTKQILSSVIKKFGGVYMDARPLFDARGVVECSVPERHHALEEGALEEACTDDAIESGCEEVEILDFQSKVVSFFCNPNELERVKRALEQQNYLIDSADHVFFAKNPINLADAEMEKLESLLVKLKAIDGVEDVFDNVDYATR